MFGRNSLKLMKETAQKASANSIDLKTNSLPACTIGASKIGGQPHLPTGMTWPECNGKSMSFIAQINLADTQAYDKDHLLPSEGVLYFFYDQTQETWGFDPADKGNWAVFYYAETLTDASPAPFPDDLDNSSRFAECSVEFSSSLSYPDSSSQIFENKNIPISVFNKYDDWYNKMYSSDEGIRNKMLGHPDGIQGDMQLECQLASNGLYCGDSSGYNDPRADLLREGAEDWLLLLQIDSDENANMMWGDVGRLYFWIKKDDLKHKRFENTWFILQCG